MQMVNIVVWTKPAPSRPGRYINTPVASSATINNGQSAPAQASLQGHAQFNSEDVANW